MGQAWYKDYIDTVLSITAAYIMLDKLDPSSMSRMMLDRLSTSSIGARTSSTTSRKARPSSIASKEGSYIYIDLELDALIVRI